MKKQSMKKQMEKRPTGATPAFATEAEEAQWWYQNRNKHGKQLLAAVQNGEAQVLTSEELRARIAASKKTRAPVVALRIPAADLALARKQAERKGSALSNLYQISIARNTQRAGEAKGGVVDLTFAHPEGPPVAHPLDLRR